MTSAERQNRRARKKGRRGVMIAYFVVVVVVITICTVEISIQAFSRLGGTSRDAQVECVEGIRSLIAAVDRARSGVDGSNRKEADAVIRYRASLEPEWSRRGAVRRACKGDIGRLETLDAVVHLGFAEEQAVRRNAMELAPFRRRASELLEKNLPAASAPGAVPVQP